MRILPRALHFGMFAVLAVLAVPAEPAEPALPAEPTTAASSDASGGASRYRIAVLEDDLPGHDPERAASIREGLRARGLRVDAVRASLLTDPEAFAAREIELLVLPTSGALPVDAASTISRHVESGGDILALGAPVLSEPLWRSAGRWWSHREWRAALDRVPLESRLIDLGRTDPRRLVRQTNTPESPATRSIVESPVGPALAVRTEDLQGWDTVRLPVGDRPFPAGHRLTCLWARGSETTRRLSLEWTEEDGSRWIAVFAVSERWRRVVLTPGDFGYWQSTPGRGGPRDRLRPERARQLVAGVAWSHTGPGGGPRDWAIADVGTAPDPFGDPPEATGAPALIAEGLAPAYKFYAISEVEQLLRSDTGERLPAAEPGALRAHHPRPTGGGFDKGRDDRWVPLIEALGTNGAWRGAPASLLLGVDGALRGSVRVSVPVDAPRWTGSAPVRDLLEETVLRMARGLWLAEAGTRRFTCRDGETPRVGARVLNLSERPAPGLRVLFRWLDRSPPGGPAWRTVLSRRLDVGAGGSATLEAGANLPGGAGPHRLRTELRGSGGAIIDAIEHEVGVWRPRAPEERRYVRVRDGRFSRGDRPLRIHGVNYMPSTGIGIERRDDFEYWIGARPYDPLAIQRDLERCRDLGLNSVSIFIYRRSLEAGNLLDILRRCDALGLLVNLSLRPGTPMSYRPRDWEDVIRRERLAEHDIIYAYDIAWEPFFGGPAERRTYDAEWRRWIVARHGGVEEAEAGWGVAAPRVDGLVTGPDAAQLGRDGPHRRLVADYRRFVDDLIHDRYDRAARRVREIDPHHLVSFRMTVTGDPTFDGSQRMPYDFPGVARAMDFLAPEGYGRIGDWSRVRPGMFTVAWGRLCAPRKPVLWAEAGVHVWDPQAMRVDPERLEFQGAFYADFFRMVLESGSDGVVWWWYPGGYRVNERSDYGILHPDGTDRPATRVIRALGPRLLAPAPRREPDVWIEVDRDADARGLRGVYERIEEEFWSAIESGRAPGLRWHRGPEEPPAPQQPPASRQPPRER